MAGSRREKIGSIFARTTGLLRSGAMKEEDRPLWYDVLKAFPPKPVPPRKEVQVIFYPEDFIRVHFYRTFVEPGATVLTNEKIKSVPQRFVDKYLEFQSKKSVPTEQIFDETVRILKEEGVKLLIPEKKQDKERVRRVSALREVITATKGDNKTTVEAVETRPQPKTEQKSHVNFEKLFEEK